MNVNIFSQKNATYENVKESIKQVYQDTIQPEADKFCDALTKFLGVEGGKLVACYDHLAILQSDQGKEAQTLQSRVTSITQLVTTNVITPSQAQSMFLSLTGIEIEASTSNVIVDKLTELSPLLANNMLHNLTINEVRGWIGLPPIAGGDELLKYCVYTPYLMLSIKWL